MICLNTQKQILEYQNSSFTKIICYHQNLEIFMQNQILFLQEQLRAEYTRTDEERLRQALHDAEQAREQEEANRSLNDITAPVMSYEYPGSIAPQRAVGFFLF